MTRLVPAIKLLVPTPSNAYVVALIDSVDIGERWPLRMAYIGAAYGVDETGKIDRSRERAGEHFPEWALQLLANDLIENRRKTSREVRDVWESRWEAWIDWRNVYGMVSALESGHNLLLTRKG